MIEAVVISIERFPSMSESSEGYNSITLPHYTDHILAERAKSAVRDFNHVHFSIRPVEKRIDVVETFLRAFIARDAEKKGGEFEFFNFKERQVVFTDWRTGESRSAKYDSLDRFQKVNALLLFAEAVPAPVWKGKKKG